MSLKKYKKFLMINAVLAIAVQNTGCGKEATHSKCKDFKHPSENNDFFLKDCYKDREVKVKCLESWCAKSDDFIDFTQSCRLLADITHLKNNGTAKLSLIQVQELFGARITSNDGFKHLNSGIIRIGATYTKGNAYLVNTFEDLFKGTINNVDVVVQKENLFRFARINNFDENQVDYAIGFFTIERVDVDEGPITVTIKRLLR